MKRLHLLFSLLILVLLAGCSTDPKVQAQRYVANGDKYYGRSKFKEASIMYRRALQKDMKNEQAWYKLGLINLQNGALADARGAFIRVADVAEEQKKLDPDAQDALAKTADIDYALYMHDQTRFRDALPDLRERARKLQKFYPGSFSALRIAGLSDLAGGFGETKKEDRMESWKRGLESLKKADRQKPYDTEIGVPVLTALSLLGQSDEAERYSNEMINRKTANDQVYDVLYRYYIRSSPPKLAQAEQVRKRQVANNPKQGSAYTRLAEHYYITKNQPEFQATLNKLTSDPKTFPGGCMMVGDLYFYNNDLGNAIAMYRQGAKVDSANRITYLKKIAETESVQGKFDDAEKVIAELLKETPQDPEVIAMNASIQLNKAKPGDADKVIAQLQPLLAKTSPNESERATMLHFNLGRAYGLKGDPASMDQARLHFQEAIKAREAQEKPPYVPALMALAQLELQREENPQAVDHATKIIQLVPSNLTARLVRTLGLSKMGEIDRARTELEAILKSVPTSTDAMYQLARLNLVQRRFSDAEAEFLQLQQAKDPRGLAGLVESKVAQGKGGDAIQLLQAELVKNPKNAVYRSALASLYYNASNFTEAANHFKQLIADNPAADSRLREDWYIRLGEALRRAGDRQGAVDAFNKAGQISPKHATPRLEIAMLYEIDGKPNEARQVYEEVLKMEPDNAIALNNLAYSKADSGTDLDQALNFAQRARTKSPDDPSIKDTLGLIYYKKDLIDDSLRLFGELVNRAPENPTFHLHLAMALYKKGDKTQAKKELDLARRYKPSDREQVQIKDLISKLG